MKRKCVILLLRMINFTCIRVEKEEEANLDTSKIFGAPTFPKEFLQKHGLDEDYYFAQINLEQIDSYLLPKKGMLYFFFRLLEYTFEPIVIYSDEELVEVFDDVNEIFGEYDFKDALVMKFDEDGYSGFILDEFDQEIPEADKEYFVLLKVDPLNILADDFPIFNNPDEEIYFMMEKEDLMKLDFSKVKLVFHGS